MHVWALSSYYYHIKIIHLCLQQESWDVENLCNTKYLFINSWAWSSYYYHMEIIILLCWELSLKEFLFSCSFSNDPKLLSWHQDTSSFSPRLEMLRVVSCAFYLEKERFSLKSDQKIYFLALWCILMSHQNTFYFSPRLEMLRIVLDFLFGCSFSNDPEHEIMWRE